MTPGDYDISDGDLAADIREARDAEWRAAVELARERFFGYTDFAAGWQSALDAVLAAMEAKR